ncbi:SURF1 family protein [Luteimonas viscosa]|uniref:SURF1-like protein n=1 Tax=Luteimonas viscosa TaxID=1132694 RepID=A0A5D4XPW3_9GAMM|nr:SURF1 family protein [Luteimonas viscosa]TYT26698.1 SURF1 family protein [Luteimonas viscosa]
MSPRTARIAGWALALLAIAAFASLGRWQLARMHQKQAVLDAVAATLEQRIARPLSAAADPDRARDYDWAAGEGGFLPGPAVLLDNQQRDGRPGVRVYRLFQPVGAAPLLVELGWLPVPPDRAMPQVAPIRGVQRVQGLLAPPPSAGLADATPAATGHGDLLAIRLDGAALPARLGVEALPPRVLKLDPDLPLGHARDLDVLPNTLPPEKHLGYAVQWFGLALAVLATALILTFRRRR